MTAADLASRVEIERRRSRARWRLRNLFLACLLLATAALVVAATPVLLFFAARHHGPKRRNTALNLLHFGASGIAWLWRELRRDPYEPRGAWHACQQCGVPIANTSRARFCSKPCRRRGRLEQRAGWGDERARSRLAWLNRKDKHDLAWGEVPF